MRIFPNIKATGGTDDISYRSSLSYRKAQV